MAEHPVLGMVRANLVRHEDLLYLEEEIDAPDLEVEKYVSTSKFP